MKIFMFGHGGSGNHGCEAIARSTAVMLAELSDVKPLLISSRPKEDTFYGVNRVAIPVAEQNAVDNKSAAFIKAYLSLKLAGKTAGMDSLMYTKAAFNADKGDLALSIGGDTYCYKDAAKYTMLHSVYKNRRAKTVLWGCSVEPKLLENKEIAKDMARYDLITARENISYNALKQVNPNTVLVSDPALTLNTEKAPLPNEMNGKGTVGINISPMIIDKETRKGQTLENYRQLCRYILKESDYSIALIPHVVWNYSDDRGPLKLLYNEFGESGRVCIIEDCGCEKLKGYISACRFLIAARTHASIAAYSHGIPTLVAGYSVKARGIAEDLLGGSEGRVIPVQSLSESGQLTAAFRVLADREEKEKEILAKNLPEYTDKAYTGAREIKRLYG